MIMKKNIMFVLLMYIIFTGYNRSCAQGVFFREYWAEFDATISNSRGRMLRVNDAELSLHKVYGKRQEALANGFTLINVPEDLFGLQGADFYLEVWGGHPGTANKRFIVNGKQFYAIPDVGTEDKQCTYSYPLIPLKVEHLVSGQNAFQFACDRGETFWGHFIIDEAAVRCYLKPGHPELKKSNLQAFNARVHLQPPSSTLLDHTHIGLSYPKRYEKSIISVEYFGRYYGFDDNGNRLDNDWHGYTHDRKYVNHIGRTTSPPYSVAWDTSMIPDQDGPMALKALVHLKGEFHYWTDVLDGLVFPRDRNKVELYRCATLPKPFWSRASRLATATINLPRNLAKIESARLMVRIWDGGEGNIKEHFKINGHPYSITSGKANHDLVFTNVEVNTKHLRSGTNTLELLSDTEHHGIEGLLPGPCLLLRYGKPAKLSLDKWTYIEVDDSRGKWGDFDEPKGMKYFGLSAFDVTGDGFKDIVSGRYFYRNPGSDMTDKWDRIDLGFNVDAYLFTDVDGDEFADVVAEALPKVYWLEAKDRQGGSWTARVVGELPKTGHINGQGSAFGQIVPGGRSEVVLSSGKGIYYFEIPDNPETEDWPCIQIAPQASEEGIGIGDIDNDGDIDIAAGYGEKGEGMSVGWWENPGDGQDNWQLHHVGTTICFADRVGIAELNGDGRADIVVAEERWPEPQGAHVFWYQQPTGSGAGNWKRHTVAAQNTSNNLDLADMDKDGDIDIITAEHRGTKELQIWENVNNASSWVKHIISSGKENHLGAQLADLDNDGDLDIIGIAWDEYQYLHLWRNDAVVTESAK
jgi:hypothetical protein